jgi:signal transduction histidine kinase/CheY-like chemotaxis protein
VIDSQRLFRSVLLRHGGRLKPLLLVAIVYVAAAKIGLLLAFLHPSATAVWPPTGVALAVLLLFGKQFWPGIVLGAFFANITTAGSIWTSCGIAFGNTLEALTGTYFVNRFAYGRHAFDRPQDVLKFAALAGFASTALSASIGVTTLYLGKLASLAQYQDIWFTWWLGDMGGAVVIAPVLILWASDPRLALSAREQWERCIALTLLLIAGFLTFALFPAEDIRTSSAAFLIVPILLWSAVRFHRKETAAAVLIASGIAIWGTLNSYGPFVRKLPNESLLLVQEFSATIAIMILTIAAAIYNRDRIEAVLRKNEEILRESDHRKNNFLATLSHELRNPLAPIRNAVQILKTKGSQDPDSVWSRDLIEHQVSQMARLMDDLLDISRITSNKLELRKSTVNLSAVLKSAVETSLPLIDEAGHQLTVALPAEPVYLDADPVRLGQIFSNLLNNAAKYTRDGGLIHLSAERSGHEVVISVKDSGVGIAPEILPHIFDMFAQAEPVLERSQGGLGIGLSLVKVLVDMHGGTIEARSDGLGRGSEFVLRLPLIEQDSLAGSVPTGKKAEQPDNRKYRVLVVDDLKNNADSLAMLLKIAGHDVETAYDGQAGLAAAERFRPEVVLLDLGMPKMNGYEVCRHIRNRPWGESVWLIAVSGWGQEEDRRQTKAAGFDDHLTKPVDPEALKRLLASLLR